MRIWPLKQNSMNEEYTKGDRIRMGIIALLIIIALSLAFLIYVNKSASPVSVPERVETDMVVSPPDVAVDGAARMREAEESAIDSRVLDITECNAEPRILKIPEGEPLRLVNSGETEVSLVMDEEHTYPVGAHSSSTIVARFGGARLFGYGCSTANGPVGSILIER